MSILNLKEFEIFSAFTEVTLITRGITKIMVVFMRIGPALTLKEPFHSNRIVNINDFFRSNKRKNTQLKRLKVGQHQLNLKIENFILFYKYIILMQNLMQISNMCLCLSYHHYVLRYRHLNAPRCAK